MFDINCDMGEGIGNEEHLMPYISSANIACGYHAGDEITMYDVIRLCLRYNVLIGAHPSFLDRENFGRTVMYLPETEVYQLVDAQLSIIDEVAKKCNTRLHHVKPHGALYNLAAKDAGVARAIASAVKDFDGTLVYYGLSGSVMIEEAKRIGLQTANEVFADRLYESNGTLTPRSQKGALLQDVDSVINQVSGIVMEKKVRSSSGQAIHLDADTICIHGDGVHAVEFAKAIHKIIHEK